MARPLPSAPLRAQLRERILSRIDEPKLKDFEAAAELGFSPGQMSRLRRGRRHLHPRPSDRRRRAPRHQRAHERDAAVRARLIYW